MMKALMILASGAALASATGLEATAEIIAPGSNGVAVMRPGFSAVNLAVLADGVDAWPDLAGSKLHSPPEFLELLPVTMGTWQLPVGTVVKFTCPDTAAVADVCDAWVFFYTCSQSCVTKYQGGVPGLLTVTPGWERSQCAPRFATGASLFDFRHPMGAFRKQLARGETETITLPGVEAGEFLAFGIDGYAVNCAQHTTVGTCPTATGKCKWDAVGQVCHTTNCKGGQGPAPLCPECPWEDVISPPRPIGDGPFAF